MASINTTCPLCEAPHAKKLSEIYSDGLSNVNTSMHSVGTFNTIGRQKITTTGTAAGIQQTDASRRAAPPSVPPLESDSKKSIGSTLLGGFGITILVSVMAAISGAQAGTVFLIAIAMIVVIFFIAHSLDVPPSQEEIERYEVENKSSLEAYRKWENTFACGSCGHRFVPENFRA